MTAERFNCAGREGQQSRYVLHGLAVGYQLRDLALPTSEVRAGFSDLGATPLPAVNTPRAALASGESDNVVAEQSCNSCYAFRVHSARSSNRLSEIGRLSAKADCAQERGSHVRA